MESGTSESDNGARMSIDLSEFALPVLYASVQEIEAHTAVLLQLDKASGGKTLWPAVPEFSASPMA